MKRVVTVFGVVHPQGGGWYLEQRYRTIAGDGSHVQIAMADSAFSMVIESEGPEDTDASLDTWINEVIHGHQWLLRSLLDSLGMHLGANLEPEMTGGTLDGKIVIANMSRLGAYGTQDGAHTVGGESFNGTWLMAIADPFVRSALADVRHALRFDEDCPFYCYRTLESLRKFYARLNNIASEPQSWQAMADNLEIKQTDIGALKKFAGERRHGGAGTSVHADHLRWTEWTRNVLAKFLDKNAPKIPASPTQSPGEAVG